LQVVQGEAGAGDAEFSASQGVRGRDHFNAGSAVAALSAEYAIGQ
jgi:hypothetical protein